MESERIFYVGDKFVVSESFFFSRLLGSCSLIYPLETAMGCLKADLPELEMNLISDIFCTKISIISFGLEGD